MIEDQNFGHHRDGNCMKKIMMSWMLVPHLDIIPAVLYLDTWDAATDIWLLQYDVTDT